MFPSHPGEESKLVILPAKQLKFWEQGPAGGQPWRHPFPSPHHAPPQLGCCQRCSVVPCCSPTRSSLFAFPPWLFCSPSCPKPAPWQHSASCKELVAGGQAAPLGFPEPSPCSTPTPCNGRCSEEPTRGWWAGRGAVLSLLAAAHRDAAAGGGRQWEGQLSSPQRDKELVSPGAPVSGCKGGRMAKG